LNLGAIAPPFAPLLQNDFKDIKKITAFLPVGSLPVKYGDKIFNEQNICFADDQLFDVFDFNVTKGNPAKALTDPYSVMLTQDMAKKYFGNEDPLNKIIRFNNTFDCKV